MKRFFPVLFLILGCSWFAAPATAQSSSGDKDVSFSASFSHLTEDKETDGFLVANLRYGQYLTDSLQLGGGLIVGGPVDDLDKSVDFEVFAAYYFSPEKTNTWYVRGGYFSSFDDPGKGFVDGAGGFKSYFNEKVAFFWEAGYGTAIDSEVDGGVVRSIAGITYTF
ncbi:MAG TPA: hypothetical protein VGS22_22795 [Thermoanaerobaculia bacterium]|jgi:hypothetical protein|nr:hypothetical protein [Thermoanaerobaculia bacterium]